MSYQYEKLKPEARLAQLEANLEGLEDLLFRAEMTVKMNEWREDDDPDFVKVRQQYTENLYAVNAVKRMMVEIKGDAIVEQFTGTPPQRVLEG